jgi:hypothetical protein
MLAPDLTDARESLDYWEDRSRRLPRRAIRKRREAREMSARWRARVAEAERAEYGRGLMGALMLMVAERRLPVTADHTGRQLARRGLQAVLALTAVMVTLTVLAMVAAVALLVAIF